MGLTKVATKAIFIRQKLGVNMPVWRIVTPGSTSSEWGVSLKQNNQFVTTAMTHRLKLGFWTLIFSFFLGSF